MRALLRALTVGLLLVVMAACGSGTETATGTDDTAADAPAEDAPAEGEQAVMGPEDCLAAAENLRNALSAVPLALSGGADTAELQAQVDTLQGLVDAAPEEIRADFQIVVGGLADFLQVLIDSGYDPSSGQPPSADVAAQLQTAAGELSSADFTGATARIQTYFQENCQG